MERIWQCNHGMVAPTRFLLCGLNKKILEMVDLSGQTVGISLKFFGVERSMLAVEPLVGQVVRFMFADTVPQATVTSKITYGVGLKLYLLILAGVDLNVLRKVVFSEG